MGSASQFLDRYTDSLLKGDKLAIEDWYRKAYPKLFRYIRSKVSSVPDAEELCHDVFLSCLESIAVFSRKSSLWSWMCSIANHEIADFYRKKYAKRVVSTLPFAELMLQYPVLDMHEFTTMVHTTVISNLESAVDKIQYALQGLPTRDRELLCLKYLDKMSVQQIARMEGTSFKSIESRLFRARRQFIQAYESA